MSSDLKKLTEKLGEVSEAPSGEKVSVWGRVMGKRGNDVVVQVSDGEFLIDPTAVQNYQQLEDQDDSEPGVEVFMELDGDIQFRSTPKNVAVFTKRSDQDQSNTPFALARPMDSVMRPLTDEEEAQQDDAFQRWRNKVGLFEEFTAKAKGECTMRNTTEKTTFGPTDTPSGMDTHGDGCEGY